MKTPEPTPAESAPVAQYDFSKTKTRAKWLEEEAEAFWGIADTEADKLIARRYLDCATDLNALLTERGGLRDALEKCLFAFETTNNLLAAPAAKKLQRDLAEKEAKAALTGTAPSESERLRACNAALISACQSVIDEWHANPANFQIAEGQTVKNCRVAIAKGSAS